MRADACGTADGASTRPQAAVVASVAAALAAPVTGVVIATPAETHYTLVQQALAAGKDVLWKSRWR